MAMFFVVASLFPELARSDVFDEDVELRRNVYVVNVARLLTSTECVRVDPGTEIVFHEPDPVLYLRIAFARYVVFHFAVIDPPCRSNVTFRIESAHVTIGADPRTLSDFGSVLGMYRPELFREKVSPPAISARSDPSVAAEYTCQ